MAEVWAALTEADQVARWLAEGTFQPGSGGQVHLWFNGDDAAGHCEGSVLVWDPLHALEYEWHFPGEAESVVRFELSPEGDATRLRLSHRMLGADHAAGYGAGWHAHLDQLEAVVGRAPVPSWDDRFVAVKARYTTT